MRLIDLFAGIGGFSLAAHWLGWQTIAFCERDEFCQKVLKKNFGQDIKIYDDITTFSAKSFRGRCDIITGGFPCQPFSHAGKREGTSDERHLFPQMLRVISEVKPRWVVAENVRGLLSIESGQVFADVISSLESEGYEVITFCIPASAIGAPHRRDRLWIIAHAKSERPGKTRQLRCDEQAEWTAGGDCSFTDTDDERYIGRRKQGQVKKRTVRARCGNGQSFGESSICDSGIAGTTSDAASEGLPLAGQARIGQLQTQTGKGIHDRFELKNSESITDANAPRLQGRDERAYRAGQSKARFGLRDSNDWSRNWLEAATALCRMDDGVSFRLDEVINSGNKSIRGANGRASGSKEEIKEEIKRIEEAIKKTRLDLRPQSRTLRLKALGNAIVPVIAFEIFRAISEAENSNESLY